MYPRINQAVILVGGKGTRLGELTQSTPKPLMPLTNEFTFLDFLIQEISQQGFNDILLLSGYLGNQLENKFHDKKISGAKVTVVSEKEPLGTGGALKNASSYLDDEFMLTNGDSFLLTSFRKGEAQLRKHPQADCSLILREVDDPSRYGSVKVNNDYVEHFLEKNIQSGPSAQKGLINAGIYFMKKAILDKIPEGASSLETDIFPLLSKERKLVAAVAKGYFIDIGLPETLAVAKKDLPALVKRPALFLDRDGVLNIDHGYVHKEENFDWIDGAKELVRVFNERGWYVIIVTNQAGIGRGYYTPDDMHTLHTYIQNSLAECGGYINGFYFCPYHADAAIDHYRHDNHPCRKPNPGMLKAAIRDWPIDLKKSIIIGDKISDIEAGHAMGIKGYLFNSSDLMDYAKSQDLCPDFISVA